MASFRTVANVTTLAAALLVPPATALAQSRSQLPIGYVSMQRILAEADDAKAGATELDTLRTAKAQELNTRKQTLDATRLQLANAGGFFAASRRQTLREQERRQSAELQQATQQAQTDFNELQRSVQDRLRRELNTIITALAKQRGFLYVLNQDAAIVLAPSGVDLTADVLRQMNAAAAERAAVAKQAAEKDSAKKP